MAAFDRLWRSAQERSWTQRPNKADVQSIASALHPSDSITGVWRVVWSTFSSSALAVTSGALLVGDGQASRPRRQFSSMLASAPATFRHGPRALVVPRERIRRVELTSERITVHTDLGPVHLPAPAGSSRYREMEDAFQSLSRGNDSRDPSTTRRAAPESPTAEQEERYPGLWGGRHLVDGRIKIKRRTSGAPTGGFWGWGASAGRAWRRLPRWAQWLIAIAVVVGLQSFAAPGGVVFAVLLVVFLAVTDPAAAAKRGPRAGTPEAVLASSGSIEARVASAACRAWEETLREPS
jgi:hypothetical protein